MSKIKFDKEQFIAAYLDGTWVNPETPSHPHPCLFMHTLRGWSSSGVFATNLCIPFHFGNFSSKFTNTLTTDEEKEWLKENKGSILVVYYGERRALEARYTNSGFQYRLVDTE
ncbi:hypothetical protein [Providencia phage PSTCR6]|nr:hypothetical protein [Providencia phage PSTCR6]